MKLARIGLGVMLLVASTVASFGQQKPGPVLIGVNIPRTGPAAPLGALGEPAIRQAVDQINATGGIKSLGGAPIEIRWADNQANPSIASAEEQRLIQSENVSLVIGGLSSGAEFTATQTAERLKVPHIIALAAANALTERGFKYTFMVSCRAVDYVRGFVDVLNALRDDEKIPFKRVVILTENSPYGSSLAKDLVPMTKEAGYEVVDHIEYAMSTSDVSALLTRIRALDPDVVLHVGYIGDSILMWNTRRQFGMEDIPFIGITSGIGSPAFMKAEGASANGALTLSQTNSDIQTDAVRAFVQNYRARYNVEPENNGFFSYQAVYVAKAALEKAASRNPEDIRNALATLELRSDVVLPTPLIKFDETGANENHGVILLQIHEGKLVTVWPKAVATQQPDLKQFDKLKK